jgi:NAD(P)-dependent dehydrogenase (short-subunit alcohol dehydrogenase family)
MQAECLQRLAMFNSSLFDLNGSRTLVTGATGAFGSDIVSRFIKYGQEVTAIGRNQDTLKNLYNIGAKTFTLDINNEFLVKEFSKECDTFDNIILSHGVAGTRPMRMLSNDFSMSVIQSNLMATLDLLSNLLRSKKINSPGRIIYLSSVAAHMGASNSIAYAASKAGGEAAMNGLARDLLKKEITVNSIAPAGVETPIYAGTKPSVIDASNYPLGAGKVSDISNAVAFLCLNGSKYITGETIIMDGGTLWID